MASSFERFESCMELRSCDRRPNHELGVWPQTRERWLRENAGAVKDFTWDWFVDEPGLDLDRREYVPMNFGFMPGFEHQVIEETDEYVTAQNSIGVVTKALKEGSVGGGRMCMDQYLEFPVKRPEDFPDIKRRLIAAIPDRYAADLTVCQTATNCDARIKRWEFRDFPLVLGHNCAANGFYWRAREFMGTEALSTAFYEYPSLMHEMMEFYADFIIETSRPVLEKIQVDYFVLNEDFAMKSGPLIGPGIHREFIFPHLKRMVEFFRAHGTKYFAVDSDGDPTLLIPLMMDAGVDTVWPIERASNVSPQQWRKQFGKSLRLWGGVDKRVLIDHGDFAQSKADIRNHLHEFIPLIEEGGFIPTIDHTVPPDVSWDNFRYYMDRKRLLLSGEFGKL